MLWCNLGYGIRHYRKSRVRYKLRKNKARNSYHSWMSKPTRWTYNKFCKNWTNCKKSSMIAKLTSIVVFIILEEITTTSINAKNTDITNKPTIIVVALVDGGDWFPSMDLQERNLQTKGREQDQDKEDNN